MSQVKQPEITEENLAVDAAADQRSSDATTPPDNTNSEAVRLRRAFYSRTRGGALLALGEQPEDYLRLMESLREDLQPREGLEMQLVTEIGEALWRMRRVHRMQEGLALKRIQCKVPGEELVATTHAAQAMERLKPFERLQEALSRRHHDITPEEIQAFAESRKNDTSEEMKEFILLLQSLTEPMAEREHKAVRYKARAELRRLMESYQSIAWCLAHRVDKVQSPENLAAMMAPTDPNDLLLQRMENSNLLLLMRLTSTLAKVRQGILKKRDLNDQSCYLYENKQNSDKLPEERSDICA